MNRQENTKNMIILFAALTVAVVWLALIVAGCYGNGVGLFDLMERIASAVNEPFNIHINQYSLKFVLMFLAAYALGIGMYFTQLDNGFS